MKTKKLPKLLGIQIDNVLHIFSPELRTQFVAQAMRALSRGSTVKWDDGRTQWQSTCEIIDSTKTGSKMYTWRGELVKANVYLHTKTRNGKVTREKMGVRYISL